MEVLNGHKQGTEMVNIADTAKGSVINNETFERNFNFGASKASKVIYLYTKYLLYWMVYQVRTAMFFVKLWRANV